MAATLFRAATSTGTIIAPGHAERFGNVVVINAATSSTVRIAASDVTVRPQTSSETTHWYWLPFIDIDADTDNCAVAVPLYIALSERLVHEPPLSVLSCQRNVSLPEATTVNVAVVPSVTVASAGLPLIIGLTAEGATEPFTKIAAIGSAL